MLYDGSPMKSDEIKLPHLICKRCGGTWVPRQDKKPKRCPQCTNPYWDKDRVRNIKTLANGNA